MAQTSTPLGPIPPSRKDDTEDVAWALSTAEAMYARGDREDALKWLRRAAEAASESDADDRALEIAKAASDLAAILGPRPSAAPPPPIIPSRPVPSPSFVPPNPPEAFLVAAPLPVVAPVFPPPVVPPPPQDLAAEDPAPPEKSPETVPEETAYAASPEAAIPPPEPTNPRPDASLLGDSSEHGDDEGLEKTRIGVASYDPDRTEPTLQTAQAVRVVVWRGPDGVRVAPHGTRVSAISVEAILVALDPTADLAAWLTGK